MTRPALATFAFLAACAGEPRSRPAATERHAAGTLELVGDPVVLGAIDEAEVRRAIDLAMPRLTNCYTHHLAKVPDLAGEIAIRFHVVDQGTVSGTAVVESQLAHSSTETCMLARVAGITFPRPRGSGAVVVTARFRAARAPSGGDARQAVEGR